MHGRGSRAWRGVALALLIGATATAQVPVTPPGYTSNTYYQAPVGYVPTAIALDDQERLFVCTQDGLIVRLEDRDRDGVAEVLQGWWPGTNITPPCLGLLWLSGALFVSHQGKISVLRDTNGSGAADTMQDLVTGLPRGWHQNNQLFTDGTRVWFGLGSTTDHSPEADPRSATMMSMNPDGTGLTIEATGLRNTYDGVFHPTLGGIVAGDNGPNFVPGHPSPRDEVNHIFPGSDYGHPSDWGSSTPAPGSQAALLDLQPHVSPTGITVNRNVRFSGYRDEVILGTWTPTLSRLQRIRMHRSNTTGAIRASSEPFVDALEGVMDLTFDSRGQLFVVEYHARRITRVVQDHPATIVIEGPAVPGRRTDITVEAPDWPGHHAWLAASVLAPNRVPLTPSIFVHLDLQSPLFLWSMTPGNGVFDFPLPAVLDASGTGRAALNIPPIAALVGAEVHLQYSLWTPTTPSVPVAAAPPLRVTVVAD